MRPTSSRPTSSYRAEGAAPRPSPARDPHGTYTLADALGLTAVDVNRTMRELRIEGLVAVAGSTVTIPDPHALRAFAEFDGSYLREIERSAAIA